MPRPSPLTAEQIAEAIRCYESGESRNSIARRYNASRPFISNCLMRRGIEIRSSPDVCRTTLPRGDVFQSAESDEEAAYWVGFLMADGCISTTKHTSYVIVQIAEQDRAHLELFRTFLGVAHAISSVPPQSRSVRGKVIHLAPHCRFCIGSAELVNSLARYGVTPRKSKTASVRGLESDRHFWRGVVDGDGSITFRRRPSGREVPILFLVGSKPLMHQFAAFARERTRATARVYFSKGVWCVAVSTRHAAELLQILYDGASVALPRKRERAARAIGVYR